MARMTLLELVVEPLAVTEINLGGRECPETYSFFGSCAGGGIRNWTPELGKALTAARAMHEKVARGAKKAEMIAFLTGLGIFANESRKASSLRTRCEIALGEMLAPVAFVNAAPNEWKCPCGHTGPATFNGRAPKCGGEGCTKPSYAMTLTAVLAARKTA